MKNRSLLIVALAVIMASEANSVLAQVVPKGPTISYTKINGEVAKKALGLTDEELGRYNSYMEGEGRYRYPNIDPRWVLGIIAKTDEERDYYAKKVAVAEYYAHKNEVEFALAYGDAAKAYRLKMKADPLELDVVKFSDIKSTDEIYVFMDGRCTFDCELNIEQLATKHSKETAVTWTIYKKDGADATALTRIDNYLTKRNITHQIKDYDDMEFGSYAKKYYPFPNQMVLVRNKNIIATLSE